MPMPVVPLNGPQINELFKGFTTQMIHSLPAAWDQLFITFRSVGDYVELRAQIITVLGGAVEWTPPDGTAAFLVKLREGMYKPGEGVWTSLRYHLVHPSRSETEYDWDNEPDWDHVPPPRFFQQELEKFPRDEENVPEWLRRRLADAGAAS